MSVGPFQILVILLVVLVFFGRGRISEMMGDVGKGVKSFRKGLAEDDGPLSRIEGPQHEAKPAMETAADTRPSADNTAG